MFNNKYLDFQLCQFQKEIFIQKNYSLIDLQLVYDNIMIQIVILTKNNITAQKKL